jgi:hypothetical protein
MKPMTLDLSDKVKESISKVADQILKLAQDIQVKIS